MDEGMAEDMARADESNAAHIQFKDGEQSFKPDNGVEPKEVHGEEEAKSPENSFDVIADILEGKKMDLLDQTDPPCSSQPNTSDEVNVVEELKVGNCDGSNVAIVGTRTNRERLENKHVQFHHLSLLRNSSPSSSSSSKGKREIDKPISSILRTSGNMSHPESSNQEHPMNVDKDETLSHEGIKTKILSKSGFSQFFVKKTLKGKGIICKGPPNSRRNASSLKHQTQSSSSNNHLVANDVSPSSRAEPLTPNRVFGGEGLTLREWLISDRNKFNKSECLYIFRQIVDLVDHSHSQKVALSDLRPSSFKIFKGNGIKYMGTGFQQESLGHNENPLLRGRSIDMGQLSKKQKYAGSSQWSTQTPYTFMIERLEHKWYASPEELRDNICSLSSNIYSIGILLFEILSHFDSERARETAMSDIRHRILPPKFLSANPKEAGFCLWLLHPEPSSRPTTMEIIQSEVINGFQDMYVEGISESIEQEDTESEMLLHFLVLSQEIKQKTASRLMEEIKCLETDIEEIGRRRSALKPLSAEEGSSSPLSPKAPEMRLIKNIHQLESVYFNARRPVHIPEANYMTRPDRDLLRANNESNPDLENHQNDRVGAFLDGLCKYARYSKFETLGVLRTGEFNNAANVICSLAFDRDEDYFATAGVSKKIKIFEFNSLFKNSVDIHYPAIEMPNRSMLSCVCWNSYIRNYLASSDYDGIVKLWDVTTGKAISHFIEHEKRAWSVDFSQVCPTKFASGSDDCSVKLWNINERNSLGTIRNIANVCSVQFSPNSTHLLAFGSADYRTYCYDLRNLRGPWCVLSGHNKAVSHVKFLDHETLITASTDNTLKLWDLKKTTHGGLSLNACGLTFCGHTNEKNFVGLSASDGYIACGSETNEVYAYHRSQPMPITSYKFGSIDAISGKEVDDNNGLFVSSVCWRKKSNMAVAANSSGSIKVLQLV